jgi:hypothetical protein
MIGQSMKTAFKMAAVFGLKTVCWLQQRNCNALNIFTVGVRFFAGSPSGSKPLA